VLQVQLLRSRLQATHRLRPSLGQPVLGLGQPHQPSHRRVQRSLRHPLLIPLRRQLTSLRRHQATRLRRPTIRRPVRCMALRLLRAIRLHLRASARLHLPHLRRRSIVQLLRHTVRRARCMVVVVVATSSHLHHPATLRLHPITVRRVLLPRLVPATRPLVRNTTLRHAVLRILVRTHLRAHNTLRIARSIRRALPRKIKTTNLDSIPLYHHHINHCTSSSYLPGTSENRGSIELTFYRLAIVHRNQIPTLFFTAHVTRLIFRTPSWASGFGILYLGLCFVFNLLLEQIQIIATALVLNFFICASGNVRWGYDD
jgi:hypothetical protein